MFVMSMELGIAAAAPQFWISMTHVYRIMKYITYISRFGILIEIQRYRVSSRRDLE